MNSRHQVSNGITHSQELEKAIGVAMDHARRTRTRVALIVKAVTKDQLEEFANKRGGVYIDATSTTDRADRISAVLGSEQPLISMQLAHRPDLGLLAAVAGTITAGGLLVLGFYAPREPSQFSHSSRRLLRLAAQLAARFPNGIILADELPGHVKMGPCPGPSNPAKPPTPNPKAITEQAALLAKACAHLGAHQGGCLVIRGRRGRGKSTLLARIAQHLEQCGAQFQITAMHQSALQVYQQRTQSTSARYVSPEKAVSMAPAVLLVEEASTFALSRLQSYLERCRHVILCTTTEGYEMSGRALDIRLLTDGVRHEKPFLQLEASQPWRWAEDDPLEQFLDAILLNRTDSIVTTELVAADFTHFNLAKECTIRPVPQEELHKDDELLSSVHGLLLESHYQTTPKDLEHLLDARTAQLWIQEINNVVVGVLLLEFEGPIAPALHQAVMSRSRRLPHQLLPQLLAQTANVSCALHRRYIRIIRIAVIQPLRRQGLATALLGRVTAQMTKPVDAIGASFAADAHTIAFWENQGYTEFHRGFRANPRTGKNAVAVLRSFDSATQRTLECAADINRDNERARQAAGNLTLNTPPESISGNADTVLSEQDFQLLQRFAAGQRSQHDTFAALQRLSTSNNEDVPLRGSLSHRQHESELRRFVQQWLDSAN